jgi:HPt (histidine-containing phosphotransfer) domain-containing protein
MTQGRGEIDQKDPIDIAELTTRCMNDPAFVRELLEIFRNQAEQQLSDLQEAIRSGNAPDTVKVAHRMSGSAGNITAHQLDSLCAALESSAKQSLAGAEEAARSIEAELNRCIAFFPQIHAKLK